MFSEFAEVSAARWGVIVALLVNYFLPRERVVALWEGFKTRIGAAK